jgi:asparagine synthase (glutamine-hydrolysing)
MLRTLARVLGDHRLEKLDRFRFLPDGYDILMNSAAGEGRISAGAAEQAITAYRRAALAATPEGADPTTRLSMLDQQTYLVSILNRQDKMSMATSIESRVPFLDTRLVRFANRLPTRYKQGRLDNKRIVKAVALRHVPAEVVKRRKSGFGVPLAEWFRAGEGLGELAGVVHEDDLVVELFGGAAALRTLHEEHRQGLADHSDTLWAALNLTLWRRAFGISSGLGAAA